MYKCTQEPTIRYRLQLTKDEVERLIKILDSQNDDFLDFIVEQLETQN